jgi:hypothetical protein
MCDAIVYGRNFTTTRRNEILLYVCPKVCVVSTTPHGVTRQNTDVVAVVRTSSHIDSCDFAWFPVACYCERDNERTVEVR